MSEALSQVGVDVEILAPFRRVGMDEDIYEYYHVERNFRLRYFSSFDFFQFSRLFGKFSYYFNIASVLFSLLCVPIESGVTVFTRKPEIAWLMKKRGYRVIYECHDWFLHARRIQLHMLKHVEHIVVTNSYIAKEFLAHGFTHERVHILPNAVSLDIFQIEVAKEDARERLGLSLQIPNHSNKKIVLYTGSFKAMGEQKGVDEIIRAMEGLGDDVVFIAVGGSQEDIEHYGQMAKHHQVSERVFLLPRCGKENLALFQQAADVLMVLFPKRVHFVYYLSPLKTFEYMASGRPIIASDLPSIREILDDTSAYFVTPGDTAELQQTITHVLTHAEEAKEKAEHARVKSEQFTWKNRAGKIASLLN
jgi:glycosyltransferase involved in cell wall biosynthesis